MTVTDISVCNRALQMLGSRNNIAAFTDDTEEAQNCSMLYEQVRDQVLSMAFWNFARRMIQLQLTKAVPGTPESWISGNIVSGGFRIPSWYNWMPAVPWLYEYRYPNDCMQFRYLISQPTLGTSGVPIFSTPTNTYIGAAASRPQRFTIGTSLVNTLINIQNITKANSAIVTAAAHGLLTTNFVWFTGIMGMTELNYIGYAPQVTVIDANTFSVPVNTTSYSTYGPTNYPGNNGIIVNLSSLQTSLNVILTNAPAALGVYTSQITDLNLWSAQAIQALITAMAGFLATPLTTDRGLSVNLFQQANDHILQARASDGNEGYTTQDITPDWIIARDGLRLNDYIYDSLVSPYPPLFSVA